MVVVHLCSTCEGGGRAALAEALAASGLPVQLRDHACFNACAAPSSLSLQGPGRATYFFTGVDPVADQADIVATVQAYLEAPAVWIEDARPCGRLRDCLTGRVPALTEE